MDPDVDYRLLFEHAAQGVFVTDAEGRYLDANEHGLELLGYTLEELRGRTIWDVLGPEERDRPVRMRELKAGKVIVSERSLQRADGSRVRAEISGRALPDGRILGLVRDVTTHWRTEQALRESEERYRTLVEGSPLGILIFQGGGIAFANPAMAQMLGYAPEELVQMSPESIRELVHPEDRETVFERIRARLAGEPSESRYEFRTLTPSGEIRWLEINSSRIEYDGEPAVQTTAADTTDRKRVEQQLLRAQKMEAVGRLAGGVAHDFNNMLAVIMAEASLMQHAGRHPREHLKEITSATERAAALVRQLLAFSRKQPVRPTVFRISETIEDVTSMLERALGENVRLVRELGDRGAPVLADRGQLEQVLVNLAVNARDAMPEGGTVRIETERRTIGAERGRRMGLEPGEHAAIGVVDDGVGMTEEVQQRLFEPFFTTKDPGRGTGLGLATCYGIVTRFGGAIEVDSAPGRGTRVEVLLPITEQTAADLPRGEEVPELPRGEGHLLLVENDPALRHTATKMLRDLGYRVTAAEDGDDALERIERATDDDPFDVVLTDVIMPNLGGAELAERLAESHPELPVVLTTGYLEDERLQAQLEQRQLPFVSKPYTQQTIGITLRSVLQRARTTAGPRGVS